MHLVILNEMSRDGHGTIWGDAMDILRGGVDMVWQRHPCCHFYPVANCQLKLKIP